MDDGTDQWGRRSDDEPKVPNLPHMKQDPSSYLAESDHPFAPFVGNALMWESKVYDDATTYEGLTREGIPHGKGIMVFGNWTGGGFQHPQRGDRYEGEFHSGYAHGLGMYTSHAGEIYRGEFLLGKRNGCGAAVNMKPFYDLVAEGTDPTAAWERTRPRIARDALYATWKRDFVAGGIGGGSGSFCSMHRIRRMLREADSMVTRARMFEHKPDGDVNIFMLQRERGARRAAQDALGVPVAPFQDPLHYPHGTKYLMPGPMGQCHPVPDDPDLKAVLAKHTRNHLRIWNMYNFARRILPGTDMGKALRRWRRRVTRIRERKRRVEEAEQRRVRRLERQIGVEPSAQQEAPKKKKKAAKTKAAAPTDDDGGDIDEDDLVASAAALELGPDPNPGPGRARLGPPPGTAFGSVGLGVARFGSAGLGALARGAAPALGHTMSRAAGAAGAVLERFAERAPRRRSLMRPQYFD